MNWLDKTIGWISPQLGYERMKWRNALSAYDAGNGRRISQNWNPINGKAEQLNQGSRDVIRAKARDLERNSDIAEAIINNFERNVIGTGIQLQSKITDSKGNDLLELNEKIEKQWKKWCKKQYCDISGRQSFSQMQKMAIRRLIVDGGILFVKIYTKDGFKLQAREVDDIDTSLINYSVKSGQNRIINGVEIDEYNKIVAFWLKTTTPDGLLMTEPQRIDASRIIYLAEITRPSQIREMSKLAMSGNRIKDINEFLEASSVKERILACLSVFIMKNTPAMVSRNSKIDAESGYNDIAIAPGMVNKLEPGDDVKILNPSGQSSNAKEHVCINQRVSGASHGLSYEASSRDMSQVNYSSARQGLLEDRKTYQAWHNLLIDDFLDEVYSEWLYYASISRQIPELKNLDKNKDQYLPLIHIS